MLFPSLLHVVNSVQWAPHEWGLVLACGSADESISFHSYVGELHMYVCTTRITATGSLCVEIRTTVHSSIYCPFNIILYIHIRICIYVSWLKVTSKEPT